MITKVENIDIPKVKLSNGIEVPCIGLGTTLVKKKQYYYFIKIFYLKKRIKPEKDL